MCFAYRLWEVLDMQCSLMYYLVKQQVALDNYNCGYIRFCFSGRSGSIVVCISALTFLMMDQSAKYSPKGLNVEIVGEAQKDFLSSVR